jgi:hypothetical protein
MTDFKRLGKPDSSIAASQAAYTRAKKGTYTPKSQYQFLSKAEKDWVDQFDIVELDRYIKAGNILGILFVMGIIVDKLKKIPDAPISADHKALLERVGQIFEEWSLINERLK